MSPALPSLALPSSRRLVLFALLAAALLAPFPARATDPPIPAPGGVVPPHAAGGWPTDLTDDDQRPKRTPEQQANLDAVANELKRLANECGPDSVVLQAKLMLKAVAAGALGPTEVRVGGPDSAPEPGHLEIAVETGLWFDAASTTPESRREAVWRDLVAPVLDEMTSFRIEPAGLDLYLLYDVQEVAVPGTGALDPSGPSRHEAFRVRLDRLLLEDVAADRSRGDALRDRARFTDTREAPRLTPLPTATAHPSELP